MRLGFDANVEEGCMGIIGMRCLQQYSRYFYFAPGGVRSILISRPMSICLSALHLGNHKAERHNFCACCVWLWFSPLLAALRYATYFRFQWTTSCFNLTGYMAHYVYSSAAGGQHSTQKCCIHSNQILYNDKILIVDAAKSSMCGGFAYLSGIIGIYSSLITGKILGKFLFCQ